MRWYKLAAEQGNADAQIALGFKYEKGQDVKLDNGEAVRWFKLAAAQGNLLAQVKIGVKYYRGEGVEQDYIKAHMWWNLAGASGDGSGFKNRDIVAEKMTQQQIAEAQRLAKECKIKNFSNCD